MPKNKNFNYTRRYLQKIGKHPGLNFTWKIGPFWNYNKILYQWINRIAIMEKIMGKQIKFQYWICYFTATGATCAKEHYGDSLLKFDE